MDTAHFRLAVRSVVVSTCSALAKTSGGADAGVRDRARGLLAELERSADTPAAHREIAEGRAALERMNDLAVRIDRPPGPVRSALDD